MMKQSERITIVEPTIRIPACRRASPKNLKTRPRSTSPKTRAKNFVMSPKEATQSRGTASQPIIVAPLPGRSKELGRPRGGAMYSLDHRDLGMRGQQRLREHVVEREDSEEGDDDGLVHRSADPLRAARGGHPLVGADDRDDRAEQGGLHDRPPQVDRRGVRQQRREERAQRSAERQRREHTAEDAEQQ